MLAITVSKNANSTDPSVSKMQLRAALKNASGVSTVNSYTASNQQTSQTIVIYDFGASYKEVWLSVANSGFVSNCGYKYSAEVLYYPGDNARYKLLNIGSEKYVTAASGTSGANVYQYSNNSTDYQKYLLSSVSSDSYVIYGIYNSSRSLKAEKINNTIQAGGNITSSSWAHPSVQCWKIVEVDYGLFKICLNGNSTLAMTTNGSASGSSGGTTSNDAGNIYLDVYSSSNDYQLWELVPLAASS